jgi:hypothetical protein
MLLMQSLNWLDASGASEIDLGKNIYLVPVGCIHARTPIPSLQPTTTLAPLGVRVWGAERWREAMY